MSGTTQEKEVKPKPAEKEGFMLSVSDITNIDPVEEPVSIIEKDNLEGQDILGTGPIGDVVGMMEDEGVKKMLAESDKDKPAVKPKEGEAPKPAIKVTREAPALKHSQAPAPAPAPRRTAAPAPQDDPIIQALDPKQKADLDFLTQAEGVMPEQFKGARTQLVDYYKELDTEIQRLKRDDPHVNLADSDELRRFVEEKKPKYDETHVSQAKEEILVDRVRNETRAEYEPKLRKFETQPRVEAQTKQFTNSVYSEMTETKQADLKEVMDVYHSEGEEAAREQFPEETGVALKVYEEIGSMGESLIQLREGMVDYDTTNPIHEAAGNKVLEYEAYMMADSNKAHQVDGGKQFLPSGQYYGLEESQRAGYWTFSTDQILKFMAEEARTKAEVAVVKERKRQVSIAKRYAKRAGIDLPAVPASEKEDKTREEAGESASITPSRQGGATAKSGDSADSSGLSFMESGEV
jgi:hypothetical protein